MHRPSAPRLRWLHIDFLTLHYAYFISLSLLTAVIFWGAGQNAVSFTDSLFMTVSAMTEAGLNTVNLSQLNTFQQVLLFLLIFVGSALPVSFVLVYVRKRAFEKRFSSIIGSRRPDAQQSSEEEKSNESNRHRAAEPGHETEVRASSQVSLRTANKLAQDYDAICLLNLLVPAYFIAWQFLGSVGLGAWIYVNSPSTAYENGLDPWWSGIFLGVSAFNNSGMSLQDANLVAFKNDAYVLLTVGLLILAGNTCYPVFLRGIVWVLWKSMPARKFQKQKETLRFLLDHPRDVYTHLFPPKPTWMLLLTVVILNGIDWAAFEILNLNNPVVTELPAVARVIDGLAQACAVRFGGFYVAPIANLNIALLVLYVLMMYISAYPVTMSMRSTNVYDQANDNGGIRINEVPDDNKPFLLKLLHSNLPAPLSRHVSRQLAHDLWYLSLAVFLIMIIEASQFEADPVSYSVFNVIFEVVSAYGTVGISVGLPGENYSFCGGWHALSKLILAAVAIRGRHRGLPDVIDRAVMMPGAEFTQFEEREEPSEFDERRDAERGHGGMTMDGAEQRPKKRKTAAVSGGEQMV